jgi:chemotaxis protein histidine kinase CheA
VNKYTRLFIQETGSYLEVIGEAMGRLGEADEDQGALGDCHRLAHSIKGMASFEEQESVVSLAYAMERGFESLASADFRPDDLIDGLLQGLDILRVMMGELEADGAVSSDPGTVVSRIETLLQK